MDKLSLFVERMVDIKREQEAEQRQGDQSDSRATDTAPEEAASEDCSVQVRRVVERLLRFETS